MRASGLLLGLALLAGAAVPAAAGDAAFDSAVRSVESRFQAQRLHIPLFGLVKFVVRVARPQGVKQLDLAVFEDLTLDENGFADLDRAVRESAGGRWRPFVRVRSRHDDSTFIYMREDGKDVRLLVATADSSDTVLVLLKIRPERLARMLDENPRRAGKCFGTEDRCAD